MPCRGIIKASCAAPATAPAYAATRAGRVTVTSYTSKAVARIPDRPTAASVAIVTDATASAGRGSSRRTATAKTNEHVSTACHAGQSVRCVPSVHHKAFHAIRTMANSTSSPISWAGVSPLAEDTASRLTIMPRTHPTVAGRAIIRLCPETEISRSFRGQIRGAGTRCQGRPHGTLPDPRPPMAFPCALGLRPARRRVVPDVRR